MLTRDGEQDSHACAFQFAFLRTKPRNDPNQEYVAWAKLGFDRYV